MSNQVQELRLPTDVTWAIAVAIIVAGAGRSSTGWWNQYVRKGDISKLVQSWGCTVR
jgi:hypothetical protein